MLHSYALVFRFYFPTEWQPSAKNRIFFEKKNDGKSPTISFTGIPFIFIGSMSFECHLGKDRAKKKKERYAQQNIVSNIICYKHTFLSCEFVMWI